MKVEKEIRDILNEIHVKAQASSKYRRLLTKLAIHINHLLHELDTKENEE